MKKIMSTEKLYLVTGGAGFIGSHLVDAILQAGHRARVLDNFVNGKRANLQEAAADPRLEIVEGDIRNDRDLKHAMSGVSHVCHLACLGVRHSLREPYENHSVNAEGTLKTLRAAHAAKVEKFLYCSSSEIYGTAQTVPMSEDHPARPHTVYGASKLAGEAYSRAYADSFGLATAIVRPFNTYGPRSHHEGDSGEFIPKSIVRLLNHKDILIFGDGSQTRDFTYVSDSAAGLLAAMDHPTTAGTTLNMGSNFEISIRELGEKLIELIGGDSSLSFTADRPGDVLRLFADSDPFRKLTGWQPEVDFADGLSKTLEYFRSQDATRLEAEEQGRNW
nr:UDP-glucose 4-epimerase-like [Nerophis lumbriciformis]